MTKCIVCGSSDFHELISFEKYPLCIGVLPQDIKDCVNSFPLTISWCNKCNHIQQVKAIADEHKEILYKDEYSELLSSVPTPSLTGIGDAEAQKCFDFFMTCDIPKGKVVDIGCYDGFFLSLVKNEGYEVFGVEPNPISRIAEEKYGIPISREFFKDGLFQSSSFDVVVLRNILEHITKLNEFIESICKILKPGGCIIIEVPNISFLLKKGALGCFFHQHLSYFSLDVLLDLLSKHSLEYKKSKEEYAIYLCVRKTSEDNVRSPQKKPSNIRKKEIKEYFSEYKKIKKDFMELLEKEDEIAIFGAGGHTTGLLYMLGDDFIKKVKYVYDNNPMKHGNNLANLSVDVSSPESLTSDKPNVLVISSYLHQSAILKQVKSMKIPNLKIVVLYPKVNIYQ